MKFRRLKDEFILGFGVSSYTDFSWMTEFGFGWFTLNIEIPIKSKEEWSYGIHLFKDGKEKGLQVSTGYDTKVWSF